MPAKADTTVKKLLALSRDLWEKFETFRFEQRIKSESDALRRLIEAGLAAQKPRVKKPR